MRNLAYLLALLTLTAWAMTPLEYLKTQTPPTVAPGSTLPPLTRCAWPLSYDLQVALAAWGYCLEVDPGPTGAALDNPASDASRLAALCAGDPARYPVSVYVYRALQYPAFTSTLSEYTWCHTAQPGTTLNRWQGRCVFSPAMPDVVDTKAAQAAALPIAKLRAKCPISIVLNAAEYGQQVYGMDGAAWEVDPLVRLNRGSIPWPDYQSRQKRRQELVIRAAVDAASGGAPYLNYCTGDVMKGISDFHWQWAFDYKYLMGISSLPSWQAYYGNAGGGNGYWTGERDILTQVLDAVGQGIASGRPLSHWWVSGGWVEGQVSDGARYEGFLKCLYTAGGIMLTSGYFTFPPGGFEADTGGIPAPWLVQSLIVSRVGGRFSYFVSYLRDGALLSGPNKHVWNKDQSAYEFPNAAGDANVRVLARQKGEELLVCAWAADGRDRSVTVDLPVCGRVNLYARAVGSLYLCRPARCEMVGGE